MKFCETCQTTEDVQLRTVLFNKEYVAVVFARPTQICRTCKEEVIAKAVEAQRSE
jgi:hypothetical protein